MEKPGVLSRLGHWFKGNNRPTNDGMSGTSGLAGSLAVSDAEPPELVEVPNSDQTDGSGAGSSQAAQGPTAVAAELPDDGQVRLIESLQGHFHRQDEQSKRVETALGVATQTHTAMTDLKRMHMDSTGLAERMWERLESQTRRLTLFAIGMFAMTLTAVVISLAALLG